MIEKIYQFLLKRHRLRKNILVYFLNLLSISKKWIKFRESVNGYFSISITILWRRSVNHPGNIYPHFCSIHFCEHFLLSFLCQLIITDFISSASCGHFRYWYNLWLLMDNHVYDHTNCLELKVIFLNLIGQVQT